MKKTLFACLLFFVITLTVFFAAGSSGAEASPSDGVGIKEVYEGDYSSVFVLKEDDSLWGWGGNDSGKLGIGPDHHEDCIVLPAKIMTNVAYFKAPSTVIKKDGSLWTWNDNSLSACDGKYGIPVKVMEDVEQVYKFYNDNTFVLRKDKSLWGWGYDVPGSYQGSSGCEPVKILDAVEKIWQGNNSYFVLRQDKSLWGWGYDVPGSYQPNDLGQADENGFTPVKILESVKRFKTAGQEYLAVTEDGSLWVWGFTSWQVGMGAGDYIQSSDKPLKIMDDVNKIQISDNGEAFFALKNDGTLWNWGAANLLCGQKNAYGAIYTPVQVLENVQSIYILNDNVLALQQDGSLWGWGHGGLWIGCEDADGNQFPVKVLEDVDRVETGKGYAVKKDGSLWACGKYVPDKMEGYENDGYVKILDDVDRVYDQHAILKDGSLYMWKDYLWRMTHDLDPYEGSRYYEAPCRILDHVKSFTDDLIGAYAAITEDDDLYVWGVNWNHIGTGINEEFTMYPIWVLQGAKSIQYVGANGGMFVIGTDGRLLVTGMNSCGMLGLGDMEEREVYVEVTDFSNTLATGDYTEEPEEDDTGFRIPEDTNSFAHYYSDFFNYEKKSVYKLTPTENLLYKSYAKKNRALYMGNEVWVITDDLVAKEPGGFTSHTSESYMKRLKTGLNRATGNWLVDLENSPWEGSCHGIAVSMALASQGYLGSDEGINGTYYNSGAPKDKVKLRDTINFYQLSQNIRRGVSTEETFNQPWCISPDVPELATFLRDLVNETQKAVNRKKPFVFGYSYTHNGSQGGHSIVAYGYIRHTHDQYTILMYDENDDKEKEPVRVSVNLAAETFSFTDANGTFVDQDNYKSLSYTGLDDLYGRISLMSAENENEEEGALLSMTAGRKCMITNERGEYISFDGENYTGTMQVYSQRITGGDRNPKMLLRVEPYESLTVTNLDSEMDLSAEVDGEYYAAAVDGAEQVRISENEISFDGEDYSFTGGTSAGGSDDWLYKVSSDAQGEVSLRAGNGELSVTADHELADTVVTALSDASAEHKDVPDGTKHVDVNTAASGEEIAFESDVRAIDINLCTVSVSPDKYTYSGKECTPVTAVLYEGTDLVEGLDYTVSYSDNINAGTARVIVTGQGDFTGTTEATFTITKAANKITKVTASKKIKYAKLKKKTQTFKIAATVKGKAKKTFKLKTVPKKAKKYIKVSSAGKVTVRKGLKKGTYKIKVQITAAATKNYKKTAATKTVKVVVK